jgi:hypothetical protein
VHWVVARLLLKGLNVPGVPWAELLAYTGYPFVMISITIVAGFVAGEIETFCVHRVVCCVILTGESMSCNVCINGWSEPLASLDV